MIYGTLPFRMSIRLTQLCYVEQIIRRNYNIERIGQKITDLCFEHTVSQYLHYVLYCYIQNIMFVLSDGFIGVYRGLTVRFTPLLTGHLSGIKHM